MTIRERMALDLEAQHWAYSGAKVTAVRQQLGWSEVRHAQVVAALLRRPDVEAELPTLVRRLRRLEEARRSQRRSIVGAGA